MPRRPFGYGPWPEASQEWVKAAEYFAAVGETDVLGLQALANEARALEAQKLRALQDYGDGDGLGQARVDVGFWPGGAQP